MTKNFFFTIILVKMKLLVRKPIKKENNVGRSSEIAITKVRHDS